MSVRPPLWRRRALRTPGPLCEPLPFRRLPGSGDVRSSTLKTLLASVCVIAALPRAADAQAYYLHDVVSLKIMGVRKQ